MNDPLVQILGIVQRYGSLTVLDHVSLEVGRSEFAVLLGPSGSGKTTLLNILGGFGQATEGRVLIAGEDMTHVPPARRPTATVFQDYALFPHMSAGSNVGFGLRMRGIGRTERRARALDALAMVGLPNAFERRPHQMSGGQRQRVALARSLVVEPLLLLLDEPLGALDLKLRRQMQGELKALQRRVGTTFVHVTHDQEEAMAIADRIIVMNAGKIEDQGTPERVYLNPATRFTALFMGDSNILEGKVVATGNGSVIVETVLGKHELKGVRQAGSDVSLALRPEHVQVGGEAPADWQAGPEAVLGDLQFLGAHSRARIVLANGTPILAHAPVAFSAAQGARVASAIDASRLVLLKD